MDLFSLPRYRINAYLLKGLGLWPFSSKTERYTVTLFWTLILITMLTPEFVIMARQPTQEIIVVDFCCCTTSFVGVTKWLNSLMKRKKILKLTKLMEEEWARQKSERSNDIMVKFADEARLYTICYCIIFFPSMFVFLLLPMRERIMVQLGLMEGPAGHSFPYYVDYIWFDADENFFWTEVHIFIGTIFVVTDIVAADTLFLTFVQHACGVFAVVCDKLETIPLTSDLYVSKQKDEAFQVISDCIRQHNRAIDFSVLLEETYCWSFFFGVCMNTMLLTLSGLQMINNLDNFDEVIRFGPFMVGQITHIFVESVIAQQLVDHSGQVDNSIKMMNWHAISIRSRKLLNLMTIRSRVINRITAGKIFVMSLEFFGTVIKTSMTYFTLLRSVQEEE